MLSIFLLYYFIIGLASSITAIILIVPETVKICHLTTKYMDLKRCPSGLFFIYTIILFFIILLTWPFTIFAILQDRDSVVKLTATKLLEGHLND